MMGFCGVLGLGVDRRIKVRLYIDEVKKSFVDRKFRTRNKRTEKRGTFGREVRTITKYERRVVLNKRYNSINIVLRPLL